MATQTDCTLKTGDYLSTSKMAILMYANEPEAAREFVNGLENMKPPFGYTRATFEIKPAGAFAFDAAGTPKLEQVTANMIMAKNDPVHTQLYNRGKCQDDNFTDIWFYLERNLADRFQSLIAIPNHVENPNGGFSVLSMGAPSKGLDDKWTWDFSLTTGITCINAFIHLPDVPVTPIFTFTQGTGTGDTITRTSGSFLDDGVTDGMRCFIDDTDALGTNYRKIVTIPIGGAADLTLNVFKSGTTEDAYLATDPTGLSTTVLRFGYQM